MSCFVQNMTLSFSYEKIFCTMEENMREEYRCDGIPAKKNHGHLHPQIRH